MADKRMFTKKVTDDDNFMTLSSSAQALFLHLSMAADDDGFCNQITVSMFKAHASVQDLQALLEKRYIYQFENGVIVIKHWRLANALRKDRYTPTIFQKELEMLHLENGAYELSNEKQNESWLPDGCQVVADRLPQIRIDKNRVDKNINSYSANEYTEDFEEFWKAYPRKASKKEALKAWKKIKPSEELLKQMLSSIEGWKKTEQWKDERYIPLPSTWLNQERWNDELPEDPYERLRKQIAELEKNQ